MRESAIKRPLYTARLKEELERGDNEATTLLHAHDQDPVSTWVGYLHPLMVKVGGEVFGWRSLGGTGKAPFRDKKQVTLEKELRVIEQLKGRLLHCDGLVCEGLEQLDLCNTSVAFFKSDAPSLPSGVPLHQPHEE